MGGSMSRYTEAHFAACLLECGPHTGGDTLRPPSLPAQARFNRYYTRIFEWYCVHFFGVIIHNQTQVGHTKGWAQFYREYFDWIRENTP